MRARNRATRGETDSRPRSSPSILNVDSSRRRVIDKTLAPAADYYFPKDRALRRAAQARSEYRDARDKSGDISTTHPSLHHGIRWSEIWKTGR